ncbi:sensor histidine kinase [Nocardioides sp.]|uniref:sensor histidine kinase n=1 Tax=Nocardioides sp. TaxID=35761 RepID=UPI0039E3593D
MAWSEESMRDSVQFIAEGIAELVGFEVVMINVRSGEEFVIVAVSASAPGHRADGTAESAKEMLGSRWPVRVLQSQLAVAEDWGWFKFIHHDVMPQEEFDPFTWIPDIPVSEEPGSWHPYDALVAPILDEDGVMQGMVSADSPHTGRYPDAAQRRIMDRYAEQAAKIVLGALQRERLREEATQVETAAAMMRQASSGSSLAEVLTGSAPQLLDAFEAVGIWCLVLGEDHTPVELASYAGPPVPTMPEVVTLASVMARRLWQRRAAAAVGRGELWNLSWTMEADIVESLLHEGGLGSVALAPIGTTERCFGALALLRPLNGRPWAEHDLRGLFDIGRDLGSVLVNRDLLERERQAAAELRQLDHYKSELIATVSHELKNPLAALVGNVELLGEDLDPGLEEVAATAAAVARDAHRMSRVVDDLLLLARVADPDTRLDPRPIDLRSVARRAVDDVASTARQAEVRLTATLGEEPATVIGSNTELEGAVAHLVRNAVKFTDPGGSVAVELARTGTGVVLTVCDTGIGIPEADQGRLFDEFFRSADPAARVRPGAGLGLAIVGRVAARHEGEISVESVLRRGSTFRLSLPADPGS